MTARKHHYIPKCYLKGFAEDRDKPRLFVIDAKTRKSSPAVPSDIAAERDFHKIAVDGLAPDALENSFSGFEGELSQALQRVITARSFKDATNRALLFNLIGLISVKNPSHRGNIRDTHEHIAKLSLQLATQTPERWQIQQQKAKEDGVVDDNGPTYEEMRDFARGENYKINVSTGYLLELELKSFDAILPYIFARKWVVVKAPPKTTGFVTSDRPICLMWSDPAQRGGFHRPGHGRRGNSNCFPSVK